MWFTYKAFLMEKVSTSFNQKETLVTTIIGGITSLLLTGELNLVSLAIFLTATLVLYLRLEFSHHMNLSMYFFIAIYLSQNLIVNLLDILMFKMYFKGGYYHDEDFLKSFSYKIYQAFLCLVFSIIYA